MSNLNFSPSYVGTLRVLRWDGSVSVFSYACASLDCAAGTCRTYVSWGGDVAAAAFFDSLGRVRASRVSPRCSASLRARLGV